MPSIGYNGTGIGSDEYTKLIRQGKKVSTQLLKCFIQMKERELEKSAHDAAREIFACNENETMSWLPQAHGKPISSFASFTGTRRHATFVS